MRGISKKLVKWKLDRANNRADYYSTYCRKDNVKCCLPSSSVSGTADWWGKLVS